nr:MAG TPA: hypothetical protein [Caudoviricetes sp.]
MLPGEYKTPGRYIDRRQSYLYTKRQCRAAEG